MKRFIIFLFLISFTSAITFGHSADEVYVTIGGITKTLQQSYDDKSLLSLLASGTSRAMPNLNDHSSNVIWINLNGVERTLQQSIDDKSIGNKLTSASSAFIKRDFGHNANEIYFKDGKSLQEIINLGQLIPLDCGSYKNGQTWNTIQNCQGQCSEYCFNIEFTMSGSDTPANNGYPSSKYCSTYIGSCRNDGRTCSYKVCYLKTKSAINICANGQIVLSNYSQCGSSTYSKICSGNTYCDGKDGRIACIDTGNGRNHGITLLSPNGCRAWEGDANYGGPGCRLDCIKIGV